MRALDRAAEYAARLGLLAPGYHVLAAVSGGCDSMCMLVLLQELSHTVGFALSAAHFNHRLRGGESDSDADFVSARCREWGIPCTVGQGDVSAWARENRVGIEEAARTLRYRFLERTADEIGANVIATAHNADDNAETVLINLLRGAGMHGLSGIPPRRGRIVRPMLCLTRAEIMEQIERAGIPFVEDSTNAHDDYTRNRLRHRVTPELTAINPRFSQSVLRASQALREDDAYLQSLADDFLRKSVPGPLSARELASLPRPVAARVIRTLCPGAGYDHVQSVLDLCAEQTGSASVSLPGAIARREYDALTVSAEAEERTSITPQTLAVGEKTTVPAAGLTVRVFEADFDEKIYKTFKPYVFKKEAVCGNIILRSRAPGDTIRLSGCTRSLKKLYIAHHIPQSRRDRVPVLTDERGVLAVFGLGADERVLCPPGERAIIVEFSEFKEMDCKC